jgi:leishmanolysin
VSCTAADVITEEKRRYLVDVLIPAAVDWFSRALSVRPVAGNLVMGRSPYFCSSANSYLSFVCCDGQFPDSLRTAGVPDTDYLLSVTARPTGGAVLAWALECQSDQIARPVFGQMNISPARMSLLAKDLPNQVSVVIHEISHALGFSYTKFFRFRKPGTVEPVTSSMDVMEMSSDSDLGKAVTRIVTPKVVEFVKSHYNCPDWPGAGAEIEDGGPSGTKLSHWEKRVVMNEIMNPQSEPVMYKSGLTLALFEDSGWYSVDYSAADKLPWGANQGCDFVRRKCVDGWSPFYFCRTANGEGCTADMRFKGACALMDGITTAPSQYQYFPGQTLEGRDILADYCPYYDAQSTRDCADSETLGYFFYGERPGSGARCFMGTYQLRTVPSALAHHGGCLQTTCNPLTNLIMVTLSGSPALTVTCPKDGGVIDLATLAGSNYVGTLMCPPSKQLCTGDPCDIQDCSGRGRCNPADGSCFCNDGYEGPDPYSCPWRTCPSRVNGTICSGHGNCDKMTGLCVDSAGLPGCFAGWSDADCGRQGCPKVNNVECAGQGACVSGACVCDAGYIGSDCSLTDCPGAPARCTSATQGTCDTSNGLCACQDGFDASARPLYFHGADCATNSTGARPMPVLNFAGEFDPSTNGTYTAAAGRLTAKQYAYYQFNVPSVQFPITLTFTARTAAALDPPPIITASYSSAGRPTATRYDFAATSVTDSGRSVTMTFSPPSGTGSSPFSQTGTIYVAVVLLESTGLPTLDFYLELRRDGCAVMQCEHGTCSNSRCICDRESLNTYSFASSGWSGTLCDAPDCPGTPDCGGRRGSCVVPDGAFRANGSAIRGVFPSCQCVGVFSGADCSSYSSTADRVVGELTDFVLDGTWSIRTYRDGANVEWWRRNDGSGRTTLNGTYVGTVDVGASRTRLLIDTDALERVGWGLNGTLGLFMRLEFAGTPTADALLLTQTLVPPTLTDYRDFDVRSWRAASKVQEISTTVSSLMFINVFNGLYGKEPLAYTLYMELSSGCPPSLRACSGHGTCSQVCECDAGWEGLRCDVAVPVMEQLVVYETNELLPGEWQYFVYRPSETPAAAEVTLDLTRTSASTAAWPLLVAAWDSGRYGTSIGKVTSETVFMDYDAVIARNGTQSVTVRRTNTQSQRWLYIGVRNMPTARSSFIGNLVANEAPTVSMPPCESADPDVCREDRCHGRGTYVVVRGTPGCECDFGWNKDTACGSPMFGSFAKVLTAAQDVGFLCSVCSNTASFARDQMAFFKIPQPLQKGTGLSLKVTPVEAPVGARLLGAGSPAAAWRARRAQAGASNATGVSGHPSLLVAATLPRSILDFVYIESGRSANQSIVITDASATGSYWAAVYANTPGTFQLAATRAKIPMPPVQTVDNIAALVSWLTTSLAGHVVLGAGGFLMSIVVLSCLCQCCCGRASQLSKVREKMDQMEADHAQAEEQLERSLIRVASLDPAKLAQTPALAKALASKKSMRKLVADMSDAPVALPSVAVGGAATQPGRPVFQVAAPVLPPRVSAGSRAGDAAPRPRAAPAAATSLLMQSMASDNAAEMAASLAVLQAQAASARAPGALYGAPPTAPDESAIQSATDLRAALRAAAGGGGGGGGAVGRGGGGAVGRGRPAVGPPPGSKGGGAFSGTNPLRQ